MIGSFLRISLFLSCYLLQVRLVDAKDYTIPASLPKDCVETRSLPCAITTGDTPRLLRWGSNQWELDRYNVFEFRAADHVNHYQGLLVLNAFGKTRIHTPFADIEVGQSKVMVHVLEEKMRVMVLNGEGVKVLPKGASEEEYLVPGFQNWYGGFHQGELSLGVPTVIDFMEYAKLRAPFFMDHGLGFTRELDQTAGIVKWAALMAAELHRGLVERKIASLEEAHIIKVEKKRRRNRFEHYLRKLFLKKLNYDY